MVELISSKKTYRGLPRGLKKVFKHIGTGDLYVIKEGAVGGLVGLGGERFLVLESALRLFDITGQTTGQVQHTELRPLSNNSKYEQLFDSYALGLVVTKDQFDKDFTEQMAVASKQNEAIGRLLVVYEEEAGDYADLNWVSEIALRYCETMPDSQARCLLYSLATHYFENGNKR